YQLSGIDSPRSKCVELSRLCSPYRVGLTRFGRIKGSPLVYTWSEAFVEEFASSTLLGDTAPVRVGMKTSDNARFVRTPWEVPTNSVAIAFVDGEPISFR